MKAVYEAPYPIPELGVETGDLITVRVTHPRSPLLVTKRHGHYRLPLLLEHIDRLIPIDVSESSSEELRHRHPRTLPNPARHRERHLRAI